VFSDRYNIIIEGKVSKNILGGGTMKYVEPMMDVTVLRKGNIVTTSRLETGNENEGGSDDSSDDWD